MGNNTETIVKLGGGVKYRRKSDCEEHVSVQNAGSNFFSASSQLF
jgi:hypothetical protein